MGLVDFFFPMKRREREEREAEEARQREERQLIAMRSDAVRYRNEYDSLPDSIRKFLYSPVGDESLSHMTLAGLKSHAEQVKDSRDILANIKIELQYKADADNPNHVFTFNVGSPYGTAYLSLKRQANTMSVIERNSLGLGPTLYKYRYIDKDDFHTIIRAMLTRPEAEKSITGGSSSRGYQTAEEIRDRNFLEMFSFPIFANLGVNLCRARMKELRAKEPKNPTLNRLYEMYKPSGLLD